MSRGAAYIPVGPSHLDLVRLQDLMESLVTYEPGLKVIVIVDHGPSERDFGDVIASTPLSTVVLRHAPQTDRGTWFGAGCVTNLVALNYLSSYDLDFILKLDTDALVIASVRETLTEAFRLHPQWGIAGTYGNSSNKAIRTTQYDQLTKRLVEQMIAMAKRLRADPLQLDNNDIVSWNLFTSEQRETFASVCDELSCAFDHGYSGRHCQGGAYAISAAFVRELKIRGWLDNPLRWLYIPFGEDRMMGAYCSAVGMETGDFAAAGEVFGVQDSGLPYIPEELVHRGNSIIHSLRNNRFASEAEIRAFFKSRRTAGSHSKIACNSAE